MHILRRSPTYVDDGVYIYSWAKNTQIKSLTNVFHVDLGHGVTCVASKLKVSLFPYFVFITGSTAAPRPLKLRGTASWPLWRTSCSRCGRSGPSSPRRRRRFCPTRPSWTSQSWAASPAWSGASLLCPCTSSPESSSYTCWGGMEKCQISAGRKRTYVAVQRNPQKEKTFEISFKILMPQISTSDPKEWRWKWT